MPKPLGKIVAEHVVDDRLEAYDDILTTDQATEIGKRPKEGSKLDKITINLLVNWRSAGYVSGMPPQFIYGPREALEAFTGEPVGDTQLLQVTEAVITSLNILVPELVDEPTLRRRLLEAVIKKAGDFRDAREQAKYTFPTEQAWQDYLGNPAFHQYVWSSERLAYQAFYNAYEDFVVECVKTANGLDGCRTSDREFNKWFRGAFGAKVFESCWLAAPVERIRLIRHSLAHASGRITKPLKDKKIKVLVHEGAIQIWPGDVRDSIKTLAPCVLRIQDAAGKLPAFA